MNDNGEYFPLFGTCLGFELLLFLSNNNQEFRVKCSSQRQSLPLNFTEGMFCFVSAKKHRLNFIFNK